MILLTRALDADLGAVMKAAESFDWSRINFILEVWDFVAIKELSNRIQ